MNTPSTRTDLELGPSIDGRYVLTGLWLRPGYSLTDTSQFRDDAWRLEAAVTQAHVRSVVVNFDTLAAPYRLPAKELCLAMLSGPLPAGERRQSVVGIGSTFVEVRKFLHWLTDRAPESGRPSVPTLGSLTAADVLDYHRHLMTLSVGFGSRENSRRAVCMLWRYRTCLTDTLSFDARRIDGWTMHKPGTTENATGRIPELVLGPLITWAIRFVDDFSGDILAAAAHRDDYRSRRTNGRYGRNSGAAEALEHYLSRHKAENDPLPGYQGRPNMQQIAAEIGTGRNGLDTNPAIRGKVLACAARVGVTDYTWMPIAIEGRLHGRPWIDGIARQHPTKSYLHLQRMLHIACYIVIAFLSGMRDAEIKHLRRGCLSTARDTDGTPYRWTLTGVAFKGEADPHGVTAEWTVGAPAARAISVLEKMHPHGRALLFSHPPGSQKVRPRNDATVGVLTTKATSGQLKDFAIWINSYCTEHALTESIPLVNGQQWVLSTRQFRRTLAWFIARRPGGSIAGAIAYRHLSIQMFEGYAGTSDSGFRAEVEAEQALARGEDLMAIATDHLHAPVTGPAADLAHYRLDTFAAAAAFSGTVITDSTRIKRLMKRSDPAIYPGTFALCVFDPDKAMCQPRPDQGGNVLPQLGHCQPLECSNTALTTANLDALRTEHHHLEQELTTRADLPPLLDHRLRERLRRLVDFLDRYSHADPYIDRTHKGKR
ncbi:hypothetical protein CH251_25945 [Rhodococcus sp. 06-462-5]|uniref:hypothetical protein n=1 Tax=Nocardiaceae TaxID=85025 RepID=UPI00050CC83E|nr:MULTISPECIES: hypothetical protein [Rhodococcus]OZC47864.1 hypothetical protein CH267_26510 [Rhodococcus sp. 06-621-2]OZC60713.1 hypothetical protein CH277_27045 [Rhodococcus sp. 06-469-3-2]OZC64136.1 hypothetical protein CH251_25945 [Rhodococcus sp. 06-462-5]OZD74447.1 hypothetical protein CH263_00745 [Rhodococcus sp. 06-1059B-a]OZE57976.1 hypothetical protein CH270_25660 [Rhodococcus sp. 02-925g]